MFQSTSFVLAASLATLALAKTDLSGCTSTDVSSPAGASIAYYVPGTGELCEFLDCGGGRAPPKTTVPGCPQYSGTLTYSPSYLPGYGSATAAPSVTSSASAASTTGGSESEFSGSSSESMTMSSSAPSSDSSMGTITSTPIAPVVGSENGTAVGNAPGSESTSPSGGSSGGNGTVMSGTPSASTVSDSGAMETARVWASGVGLMGLGALVVAL